MQQKTQTQPTVDPPNDSLSGVFEAALDRHRRRLSGRELFSRLAGTVAVAVSFPLVVVVTDHFWPGGLPNAVVAGAAFVWAGGVVLLTLTLIGLTLFRRVSALFAAQTVEREYGIRHNTLINALLLRRSSESSFVAAAAARRAGADVASHPARVVVLPTVSKRPLAALALTFLAWVIYVAVSPKSVLPSLARFFGAPIAAPTATQLECIRPGPNDVIHAGEPLQIEIEAAGRPVESVSFEILRQSGDAVNSYTQYAMRRGSQASGRDRWQLALAPHEVSADIHYRSLAGDARLEGVIRVQPQPDLTELKIRVEPPAYTGLAAEEDADPHLRIWAGSRVTFSFEANVAIFSPVFVLEGATETRTRMTPDRADPRRASTSLVLASNSGYWIEFTDRWGYARRDPPRYRILVREDRPPTIQIVVPSRRDVPDDRVDVSRFPELVVMTEDDFGISAVELVREVNGVAARSPVAEPSGPRYSGSVATAELTPEPGFEVLVWFEAKDNRVMPDGAHAAQTARSRVLTLFRPADDSQRGASGNQTRAENRATGGKDGLRGESGEDGRDRAAGASRADTKPEDDENAQRGRPEEAGAGQDDASSEPKDEDGRQRKGMADEPPSAEVDEDTEALTGRDSEPPSDSPEEEFERAAKEFEDEYGDELREAGQRLRKKTAPESGEQEPNRPEDEQSDRPDNGEGTTKPDRAPGEGEQGEEQSRQGESQERGELPDAGDSNRPESLEKQDGSHVPRESSARGEADDATPQPRAADESADPESRESSKSNEGAGENEMQDSDRPEDRKTAQGDDPQAGAEEGERVTAESDAAKEQQQGGKSSQSNSSGAESQDQVPSDASKEESDSGKQPGAGKGNKSGEGFSKSGKEGSDAGSEQPGENSTGESAQNPPGTEKPEGQVSDAAQTDGESSGGQGNRSAGAPTSAGGGESAARSEAPGSTTGQSPDNGDRVPGRMGGGEDVMGLDETDTAEADEAAAEDASAERSPKRSALESAGRQELIDLLEMLQRGDDVAEEFLEELGWPTEKTATFLDALKRLHELKQAADPLSESTTNSQDVAPGDREVQRGRGLSEAVSTAADAVARREDSLRKITAPPEQRVAPALRRLLDEYYRSLARHRAAADEGERKKP